ncbi:MAG: hypothetical protein AAF725_22810, partial [Acidobacteriota bacterium]
MHEPPLLSYVRRSRFLASRRTIPLLAILALAAFWTLTSSAQPVNEKCPVRPEDPLVSDLSLHYGDHEIGFCCEHCRGLFAEDPEPYLQRLPEDAAAAVRAVHFPEEPPLDLSAHLDVIVLAILLLVAALAWQRGGQRASVGLIAASLLLLSGVSWWRAQSARGELMEAQEELSRLRLRELIHNNTYYDFGDPPRPLRPPVGPRLASTFYRGNDERSDRLFNGGHYLTSSFDLSILDAATGR